MTDVVNTTQPDNTELDITGMDIPTPITTEGTETEEIDSPDDEFVSELPQIPADEDESVSGIQEFLQRRNQAVAARTAAMASLAGKKKFSRADINKVFTAFAREADITEQLCSMLLNDSFQLSLANAQMQQQMFQLGQTNALLKMTLVDRPTPATGEPIITQKDIETTWETKLKPELESRMKQAERKANPSGLVTPNGAPVETVKQ